MTDFNEEDFADVIGVLKETADPLPHSLRDRVLEALDRGSAQHKSGGRMQIIAAATFLAGLTLLAAFPRDPGTATAPATVQDHDSQRVEDLKREIARMKEEIRALEAEISRLRKAGESPSPAVPAAAPLARVTAVATEIGLVVISLGTEDGIVEGAKLNIHRDGAFVARIVIDRTDRKWSAGKIELKGRNPQVGDLISPLK